LLLAKGGAAKVAAGGLMIATAAAGKFAGALALVKTVIGVIIGILTAKIVIIGAVVAAVAGAVYLIVKYWEEIVEAVQNAVDAIKEFFEPAIDWLLEKWQDFREGVLHIWRGITDSIRGFINTIIKGVNLVIGALNQISLTVPDWVPEWLGGGQYLGFDIGKIPTLHQGGVYRAPTPGGEGLALLRDRERVSRPGESGGGNVYIENNFHVAELVVREEADIERVAERLHEMQQGNDRGVG